MVTKLDRLVRSVRDLLEIVDRVKAKGANLKILGMNLDTSNATSRFMLQTLGAVGELDAHSCWKGKRRASPRPRQLENIAGGSRRCAPGSRKSKTCSMPALAQPMPAASSALHARASTASLTGSRPPPNMVSDRPAMLTSSWFTQLPDGFARIGISRRSPRGGQRGYRMYRALQPGPWFSSVDEDEYRLRYNAILKALDPRKVVAELQELAQGRIPVLLCFEFPPPDPNWCHRGLVSAWFIDTIGLAVPEWGHEGQGFGWSHPKLPARLRQQAHVRYGCHG